MSRKKCTNCKHWDGHCNVVPIHIQVMPWSNIAYVSVKGDFISYKLAGREDIVLPTVCNIRNPKRKFCSMYIRR